MLEQAIYEWNEPAEIVAFIHDNPWATIISAEGVDGLEVSHFPLLLERNDQTDLTVCGHLARRDAERHRLGETESVLVVQGPNGYISPSFYPSGTYVPTWNFVVAHLHGRVETFGFADTWEVLGRTVDRFESVRAEPWSLDTVEEYARQIAHGAVGFRMQPRRIVAKAKLSQDKPLTIARAVMAYLESDETYSNHALSERMRKYYDSRITDKNDD